MVTKKLVKKAVGYPCLTMTQNKHKFYLTSIPVSDLFQHCFISTRNEDNLQGFQRQLSKARADDISQYLNQVDVHVVLFDQTAALTADRRFITSPGFHVSGLEYHPNLPERKANQDLAKLIAGSFANKLPAHATNHPNYCSIENICHGAVPDVADPLCTTLRACSQNFLIQLLRLRRYSPVFKGSEARFPHCWVLCF